MNLEILAKKSTLILGFGREGQATYEFLRSRWPSKRLALADRKPLQEIPRLSAAVDALLKADENLEVFCGDSYPPASYQFQVIVKTPGIPPTDSVVADAAVAGVTVTSHLEIFLENYPTEKIIGITGTKGKSTTTSLVYQIAQDAGIKSVLAGNIGEPPLPKFIGLDDEAIFVCELSSHQLAPVKKSPHIAVLLGIVPEHLDYYATFDEYVRAKENITRFQSGDDWLIYYEGSAVVRNIAARSVAKRVPFSLDRSLDLGCYCEGGRIMYSDGRRAEQIIDCSEIPLIGKFNYQNVMAAIAVGRLLGISGETIKRSVRRFTPLAHRLAYVGEIGGVRFYDDSIATVPQATLGALDALGATVQTLMLGGYDRNLDFTDLARGILISSIETLILFPPAGNRMWHSISQLAGQRQIPPPKMHRVDSMDAAVRLALQNTAPGRVCLLSPAAASFGLFRDYADRGDAFVDCVKRLGQKPARNDEQPWKANA